MCGWQGGWRHFRGAIFEIGLKGPAVAPAPAEAMPEGGPGFRPASGGGKLGRVVILRFATGRRTFSSLLRCPYNRRSGASGNPSS